MFSEPCFLAGPLALFKHRQPKHCSAPGSVVVPICSVWSREEPCRQQGFLILLFQPPAGTGEDENCSPAASTGLSGSGARPAGLKGWSTGTEGKVWSWCVPVPLCRNKQGQGAWHKCSSSVFARPGKVPLLSGGNCTTGVGRNYT